MLRENFDRLLTATLKAVQDHYRERLVALAVYGSVARGTAREDSDVDLLIVCDSLPLGRIRRIEEFDKVEKRLEPVLRSLQNHGISTSLSVVLKTPDEVRKGSPLYLDLVEDARILFDRGGFFRSYLDELKKRLARLGARRVWRGNAWYWDLKPDFKPGDVIEL